MQKLTPEQITFIDTYLQKSDVIFVDVRAELTDHIASAVEEKMEIENLDFYDAFKDFMAHNKKELLRKKNNFLPPLFSFGKTLYQPYNLMIGAVIVLFFYFISKSLQSQNILKTIYLSIFYGIFAFAFMQGIYTLVIRRRFAYLEKVTFWLLLINYINLFFNGFHNHFFGNSASVGIVLFLFIAFLIHFVKTILKFNPKLFVR